MPKVTVTGSEKLTSEVVSFIKNCGHYIGYDDPKKIWVELSDGLTQDDVLWVLVQTEEKDWRREPGFTRFCTEIGAFLRLSTGKSVEVLDGGPVRSVAWSPTEEGKKIYGE